MPFLPPAGLIHRSRRRLASGAIVAAIGVSLTLGAIPAAAVTRTPYSTNFVRNGSFEAGSANSGYAPIAVPSWTTYPNMTVVKYGAPNGFPSLAEGARISGGKKFFTIGAPVGSNTTCMPVALQVIKIRGRGAAIDALDVRIDASVYIGTYGTQTDTAVFEVRFNDYRGQFIDGIRYSTSATNAIMYGPSFTRLVPVGTRSLTIYLYSKDTQGYCDAYFDRISVKLFPN